MIMSANGYTFENGKPFVNTTESVNGVEGTASNNPTHHFKDFSRGNINPYKPDDVVKVSADYRFRGYPSGLMISPRMPATRALKPHLQPDMITSNGVSKSVRINEGDKEKWTDAKQNDSENFMDQIKQEDEIRRSYQPISYENRAVFQRTDAQGLGYNPWGKPGAGAPRIEDNRKQKFTELDLQLDHKYNGNLEGLKFYRPGAGAPNVNKTGDLQTEVRADPSIRYREGIKNHPHRYWMPKDEAQEFLSNLRKAELERAQRQQAEREWNLKAEQQALDFNPFGRPGAGAPNFPRDDSYEISQDQDQDLRMTLPIGEIGAPVYDVNGMPLKKWKTTLDYQNGGIKIKDLPGKSARSPEKPGFLSFGSPGGGSPRYEPEGGLHKTPQDQEIGADFVGTNRYHPPPFWEEHGQPSTRLKQSLDYKDGGKSVDDLPYRRPPSPEMAQSGFLAFGSQGGGSPRFDKSGNLLKGNPYEFGEDTEKRRYLKEHLMKESEKQILLKTLREKQEENERQRRQNVTLIDRMMDFQAGKPRRHPETSVLLDQHRLRTDVGELLRVNIGKPSEIPKYQEDLKRQMYERQLNESLSRVEDKNNSSYHYQESPRYFGLPGGGAPNHETDHRKPKLMNILMNMPVTSRIHPPSQTFNPYYRSSHCNQYEIEARLKNDKNATYTVDSPYATGYNC